MKDHVGDHKIKSVDLYTSQNPCSVDTFTAKKVKDPPQSSSCASLQLVGNINEHMSSGIRTNAKELSEQSEVKRIRV